MTTARHIPGFDHLRIAGLFAVVWIHGSDTNPTTQQLSILAGFAVPAFLMMSSYLAVETLRRHPSLGFVAFMRRRLERLVPAYLLWTGVYLLFRHLKHTLISHEPMNEDWVADLFCGGAAYHLWYVPGVLYLTALFFPVLRMAQQETSGSVVSLCVLLAAAGVVAYETMSQAYSFRPGLGSFCVHYLLRCAGCVPAAVAVWVVEGSSQRRPHLTPGLMSALAGILALGAAALHVLCAFPLLCVYALATSLFLLALSVPASRVLTPRLAGLSSLCFGAYLTHALFVEGFQSVAAVCKIDVSPLSVTTGIIACSFALSLLVSAGLSRVGALRWMVVPG